MFAIRVVWLGSLLFACSVWAGGNQFFSPGCRGCLELGGQALYWRATACEFESVASDSRPFDLNTFDAILPQGKMLGIDPTLDWGARVFLGYVTYTGCHDLRLTFSRLRSTDQSQFLPQRAGGLWAVFSFPTSIEESPVYNGVQTGEAPGLSMARASVNYDALDLELAYRQRLAKCWKSRAYVGLQYAVLERSLAAFTAGTRLPGETGSILFETISDFQQHMWGIGPLLGCDLDYRFCGNFGLEGRLSSGLMAGGIWGHLCNTQRRVDVNTQMVTLQVSPVQQTRRSVLFPQVSGSLSLTYSKRCGDLRFTGEIGWEFRTYINALGRFQFNDQRGTLQSHCESLSFNGLFFGLKLTT